MFSQLLFALALVAPSIAVAVSGKAPGFASGTTGGSAGQTVTPTTTSELTKYLTAKEPLTIVLTKAFDYRGSEGTASGTGCAPWGTGSNCQLAINQNDWCKNYQGSAPSVSVSYDKAGIQGINVASDKTIIGQGSSGAIKGKGLAFQGGVKNIILQNVAISDLNPKYVWGGDAITLNGASNIWIDHVTISNIGRMMIVAGSNTNNKIAITNSHLDGRSSWSATCNGEHYWAMYFIGQGDQITLKGNYIHHTSGRSPKIGAGTVLHAVNNYWADNSGHAFEGENSWTLLEGSIFSNVKQGQADFTGSMYARNNKFLSSGSIVGTASSVLSKFQGVTVAPADLDPAGVPNSAGVGKV